MTTEAGPSVNKDGGPESATDAPRDGDFTDFCGLRMTKEQQRECQLRLRDMLKPPTTASREEAMLSVGPSAAASVSGDLEEGECASDPPVSYMSNLVKDLQRSVEWAPVVGPR